MLDAYHNMIENQLRAGGIHAPEVFNAFDAINRPAFVPESYRNYAYADIQIPLENGQQMFFPRTEAAILQAVSPKQTDIVLEIGTGTGYSAALMAQLTRYITTLEIMPEMAKLAQQTLKQQNIHNAHVICTDAFSWDISQISKQPDIIIFSGATPSIPAPFYEILAIHGKMVVFHQLSSVLVQVQLIQKTAEHTWQTQTLFETNVIPLVYPNQSRFIF